MKNFFRNIWIRDQGVHCLNSSVKWGHLAHFEPNSIKTISSTKILRSHLAHFEPDSVTTITKNQNKNQMPIE